MISPFFQGMRFGTFLRQSTTARLVILSQDLLRASKPQGSIDVINATAAGVHRDLYAA